MFDDGDEHPESGIEGSFEWAETVKRTTTVLETL
jgi:hypothetical protein